MLRERPVKDQGNNSSNESSDVFDSDHNGRCASTYVFLLPLCSVLLGRGARLKATCGRERVSIGCSMHTHILIPTDGSALSLAAVEYGVALAKSVGAKVTVLTVSAPFHIFAVEPVMVADTSEQHAKQVAALAKRYLDAAQEIALAAGVSCETVHVEHDHPYLAIIETAEKKSCDLIIMASHGRHGISAFVLGSETNKVLTHSSIPVLVVRPPRQPLVFVAS